MSYFTPEVLLIMFAVVVFSAVIVFVIYLIRYRPFLNKDLQNQILLRLNRSPRKTEEEIIESLFSSDKDAQYSKKNIIRNFEYLMYFTSLLESRPRGAAGRQAEFYLSKKGKKKVREL